MTPFRLITIGAAMIQNGSIKSHMLLSDKVPVSFNQAFPTSRENGNILETMIKAVRLSR